MSSTPSSFISSARLPMVDSIPSSRSLIKISHLYEKILSPKEAFLLKQNNNYGNLQRSFLTESNSKNLLDSTTCIRCSQTVMERAWTCTVFSQVFLWHRTCVESDKSQGEGDGKWSLFFFTSLRNLCQRASIIPYTYMSLTETCSAKQNLHSLVLPNDK